VILYFIEWGYILAPIIVFLYYYFIPTLVLDSRIKRRKKKLEQEAIFFFEVLSLSVESGNNLFSAIELTSNSVESELSTEFQRMLNEVHIGKSFVDSVDSLSKRIPSDSIKNILLNIKQASIMGNDINETLKNQLSYIRETKILETRAYISKIPLKISVISVVFFIPLLLLMILGPIIIEYIG
jgi:tight adherence protein C